MKAKFSKALMGYTGRIDDDTVIYYNSALQRYILRRLPKREITQENIDFGNITKHLFALNPSDEYIADLKKYLKLHNQLSAKKDDKIPGWPQLYIKLMWQMHHIFKVDLINIVDEDFVDLPCRSVACAVEQGLLPKVKDYWLLSALI